MSSVDDITCIKKEVKPPRGGWFTCATNAYRLTFGERKKKNCETYPNSRRGSQDLNIMIRSMTPPLRRNQHISSCLSGPPSLGYPRPVISLKTINTWVWSYRVRITWRIERNKAERAERTPIHSILSPELAYSTQGAFDHDIPFFPKVGYVSSHEGLSCVRVWNFQVGWDQMTPTSPALIH